MLTVQDIKELLGCRVSDAAAARLPENIMGLPFEGLDYVISLCVRLSDPVIDGIKDSPTHSYFHHYRTVNRALDDSAQLVVEFLRRNGYRSFPIAASQSVNNGGDGFHGVFSHKQAAVYCKTGFVGINNLFIHSTFGVRVRLATVFTDCPITDNQAVIMARNEYVRCNSCKKCISACPAHAITENGFDPQACSDYMKKAYQLIGRGSVCGRCMYVCDGTTVDFL